MKNYSFFNQVPLKAYSFIFYLNLHIPKTYIRRSLTDQVQMLYYKNCIFNFYPVHLLTF